MFSVYAREALFSLISVTTLTYNQGNKLSGQMRKTALCLTPQAI